MPRKDNKPTKSEKIKPARLQNEVKSVRVRMYRHGLGDCFLLTFSDKADLSNPAHALIDFGTLGTKKTKVTMKDVMQDIKKETNSHLSLLVATHEHLDHVSGFKTFKDEFANNMKIDNGWVAWTEDPKDPLAKKLQKYKGDLALAAFASANALSCSSKTNPACKIMAENMLKVTSMLGAADLKKTVDEAMKGVTKWAVNPAYLAPGTYLQPDWLPGVTVFVLGPPRDIKKISNMGEHGSPELYELNSKSIRGFAVAAASDRKNGKANKISKKDGLDEDAYLRMPFEERFRISAKNNDPRYSQYFKSQNEWRRIDSDWLLASSDFALQLDNLTNNTTLVLAFEIGEDGPVILMAGDAQLGNWLSWHDYTWEIPRANGSKRKVIAKDLLERTQIYKVGHHSSHNATAVAHGLEMMNNKALLALIPLDSAVAKSKKWSMPAKKLYERLKEKTCGRVFRSDNGIEDSVVAKQCVKSGMIVAENNCYLDVQLNI